MLLLLGWECTFHIIHHIIKCAMTRNPRRIQTCSAIRISGLSLLISLGIMSAGAQSPVPPNAVVEKLATGFVFVEGPVWNDSLGLLFSDLNGNKVYRWTEATGAVAFLNPSSNANGLAYDSAGRLILAQTGLRRVARRDSTGGIVPLATIFGGKKLSSPNDVVVKSDGAILFTDPPFNIPIGQHQELSFSGIFRISPSGALQLLDSTLSWPNGICFSPDESKFYVAESQQRIIYVWDVVADSMISNKREFARITPTGYADGMKVDTAGNLFCAGPLGIWVFAPTGAILDTILLPETATNCSWGDTDRKTLYITAGRSIYRIRLAITGVEDHSGVQEREYQLFQNYPNPFNPRTNIGYSVGVVSSQSPVASNVRLVVYDLLGREVAVLVDEKKQPGEYVATWDATGMASGVYFCRLMTGGACETKTMLLLR